MGATVFVTGGTGFIGANVVRLLLQQGYFVKTLVRPDSVVDNLRGLPVEMVRGDIHDPNLAQLMRGCKFLFHLAAHYSLGQRDRQLLYYTNVVGTNYILAAARQAGVERTVYTSSVAAIGVGEEGEVVDENYQSPPEKLVGHYKKSKYWGEQEVRKAAALGQDIVIVNPSTPIGAYDLKPTPTGEMILRFLRRRMPAYVNTGLNFVDVRDVAWGHLLALQKGKTGDRYILGNQNLTLKAFLDLLSEVSGIKAPQDTIPLWLPLGIAWIDECLLGSLGKKPSIPLDGVRMSAQSMYYSSAKAVRELGLPQSPLKEAIVNEIEWFKNNGFLEPSRWNWKIKI
jgi:dihydroflavonol-4-reductase